MPTNSPAAGAIALAQHPAAPSWGPLSRRQFGLAALAALAFPSLQGCGGGSGDGGGSDAPPSGSTSPAVTADTAYFGKVDDAGIDAWELEAAKRTATNLRQLLYGLPMVNLLESQLAQADSKTLEYLAASKGAWTGTQVTLTAKSVKTADLMATLMSAAAVASGDFDKGRDAVFNIVFPLHPEHYGIPAGGGNIETMGGIPTETHPARVAERPAFMDSYVDSAYPTQLVGGGSLRDRTTMGNYVFQQYRDTADGMEAKMAIWYPAACPPIFLEEHAQHYAIEFRNGARHAAKGGSVQVTADTAYFGKVDDAGIDAWELEAAKRTATNLRQLLYGLPMVNLLESQLAQADSKTLEYLAASKGAWTGTQVTLTAKGVKTADLMATLMSAAAVASGDFDKGRDAVFNIVFPLHPEHYGIPAGGGNIETMGGIPTETHPARVAERPAFMDSYVDSAYPTQLVGGGSLRDRATMGNYVLQQYRDTADGMEAKMAIWYPAACPPIFLKEHAQHYAIEFRNGVRHAAEAKG